MKTVAVSKSNRLLVIFVYLLAFALLTWSFQSYAATKKEKKPAPTANPTVVVKTNMGDITIQLNSEKAPISTENFLKYVDKKFYDGTIFHRVIPSFMIQGGGMTPDMKEKETLAPIKNEAINGLKNTRGTVAMARTDIVDSATAQFFINTVDNPFLDHKSDSQFGYAVFGEVKKGMDVVDKIKEVATATKYPHENVPVKAVIIESIRRGK